MESNLNATQTQVNQNVRFELLSIDEFKKRPQIRWVAKNLLPAQGLAIMFGQSGTGKTFMLLDLLLAIANGDNWFGHATTKTPVCYVCLEGVSGISQRIAAWEIATGKPVPDNFRIITNSFILGNRKDVLDLAKSIQDRGFSNGVIAIDTLNAATPTMEENSSKEMGTAIDNLRLLQRQTNGLVMTTHHTGKDETKGMRGHSSLHGAIDVEIYLKGTKTNRSWILQKIRDFENGESHNFKLVIHDLGLDEDGEITTSCSIEADTATPGGKRMPTGQNQRVVYAEIRRMIDEESKIAGCPVMIDVDRAIQHGAPVLTEVENRRRRSYAEQIIRNLIAKNYFENRIEKDSEYIG